MSATAPTTASRCSARTARFVKEFRVEPQTLQNGSVWDLVLSEDPQQKFIFMADGANGQIVTLDARRRQGAHAMGPPRPPAGPVQMGAQHRHRFQGQSLHRRGRLRPARAEVQENVNDQGLGCGGSVHAVSLVPHASAWNDIFNSVWGHKSNDTGGIIPWSPENERNAFAIADAAVRAGTTSSRSRPASTGCPATTSPTAASGTSRATTSAATTRRRDEAIDMTIGTKSGTAHRAIQQPDARGDFDRAAIAAARRHAIVGLARIDHRVGEPDADRRPGRARHQQKDVRGAAVARLFLGRLRFFEIVLRHRVSLRQSLRRSRSHFQLLDRHVRRAQPEAQLAPQRR